MAITNVPTWTDGEIVTAAKLNQLGTAITTKFSGAVSGSDLTWPLVAQGNIDMNSAYNLINLRTMWGVINADEYGTLSAAVAALPSGGGAIFIPPNTTITADGVALTKPVLIFGAGKTSVLKLTTSATSGYLMRVTGTNDVDFCNLTVDGNSSTGSSQDGIQLRQIDGARVLNVWFKNFSGSPLSVGNDGTGGNNCTDVFVGNCKFEGGSADHLNINDVDGLSVHDCRFENPTTKGINAVPTNTSSKMRSIRITGCKFDSCNGSIHVVGASGTANDLWRLVYVAGNEILSDAGNGITLGTTSAVLKYSFAASNFGVSITGDGLNVLVDNGVVSNNYFPAAGGDGCDALASQNVLFFGNHFPSATAKGIDGSGTTSCRFVSNDVTGSADGLELVGATTPYTSNNMGVTGNGHIIGVLTNNIATTRSGDGVFPSTMTIPANTLSRVGDGIHISWRASCASGGGTIEMRIGGVNVATMPLAAGNGGFGWADVSLILGPSTASNTVQTAGSVNDSDNGFTSSSTVTIDWTGDLTLDFNGTGFPGSDALEVTTVHLLFVGA